MQLYFVMKTKNKGAEYFFEKVKIFHTRTGLILSFNEESKKTALLMIEKLVLSLEISRIKKIYIKRGADTEDITVLTDLYYNSKDNLEKYYFQKFSNSDFYEWEIQLKRPSAAGIDYLRAGEFSWNPENEIILVDKTNKKQKKNFKKFLEKLTLNRAAIFYFKLTKENPVTKIKKLVENLSSEEIESLWESAKEPDKIEVGKCYTASYFEKKVYLKLSWPIDNKELELFSKSLSIKKIVIDNKPIVKNEWIKYVSAQTKKIIIEIS